jgi:hypothetical protein
MSPRLALVYNDATLVDKHCKEDSYRYIDIYPRERRRRGQMLLDCISRERCQDMVHAKEDFI